MLHLYYFFFLSLVPVSLLSYQLTTDSDCFFFCFFFFSQKNRPCSLWYFFFFFYQEIRLDRPSLVSITLSGWQILPWLSLSGYWNFISLSVSVSVWPSRYKNTHGSLRLHGTNCCVIQGCLWLGHALSESERSHFSSHCCSYHDSHHSGVICLYGLQTNDYYNTGYESHELHVAIILTVKYLKILRIYV